MTGKAILTDLKVRTSLFRHRLSLLLTYMMPLSASAATRVHTQGSGIQYDCRWRMRRFSPKLIEVFREVRNDFENFADNPIKKKGKTAIPKENC